TSYLHLIFSYSSSLLFFFWKYRTIMSSKRTYQCEHCKLINDFGELSLVNMQVHNKKLHRTFKAKCLDCQMAFSSSITLKLHRCRCNQQCHEMEESSPDEVEERKKK
ncbi:hypothetical protein AABB24_006304, partial [Solanum stoloniferum]